MRCILFFLLFPSVLGDQGNLEQRLRSHLMDKYNRKVRPVRNSSRPVNLSPKLSLIQILQVRMVEQTLQTSIWLSYKWHDEYLTWNTSQFPLERMFLNKEEIWRPDIIIYNLLKVSSVFAHPNALVLNDGTVTLYEPMNVVTSCQMNVHNFPFDEQWCNITVGSWTYSGTEVAINVSDIEVDFNYFTNSSEWDLLEVAVKYFLYNDSCCPNMTYTRVDFVLHMRRFPHHVLWNLVAPCIALLCIAIFGSIVPPASGERVGLSITTLLSFTVFLLMVPETLPPNRTSIPLIAMFFGVSVLLMSLNTVWTVVVVNLRCHSNMGFPPGPHVQYLLRAMVGCMGWLERDLAAYLARRRVGRKKMNGTVRKEEVADAGCVAIAGVEDEEVEVEETETDSKEVWQLEWILMSKLCDWLGMVVMVVGSIANIAVFLKGGFS